MIEYLIVMCDTNHLRDSYRVERLHANDADTAARDATDKFGGRLIIKAVVEYEYGEIGEIMSALRKELS